MRLRRLEAAAFLPVAYYHCVSRVVDRRFAFGEKEKDISGVISGVSP